MTFLFSSGTSSARPCITEPPRLRCRPGAGSRAVAHRTGHRLWSCEGNSCANGAGREGLMNYGVVLPIWQLTVAEAESLAARAEQLGPDGVSVPDHILAKPATTQHYGGHWPDPFSLLAYLAGRTHRIHLGASVIVLPYRNALVAAALAATRAWAGTRLSSWTSACR